jgi:methionine sulfoxide reductase heme-binding subunit
VSARRRRLTAAKWGIGVVALLPVARMAWQGATGSLGANPIAEVLNRLGFWTLVLLMASLAMTPLKLVTGWTWPIALRRLLGLLAFTYVCLHFGVYLGVDQFFDLAEIGRDIVKRPFITVGFAAFVLLIPLAITSTAGMLKRLGARRWKRLHRLVYLVGVLGVVHFLWRVKSDTRQPLIFAAVLAVLLGVRVVAVLRGGSFREGGASTRTVSVPRA